MTDDAIYTRKLRGLKRRIERREQRLAELREERNLLIYEACEAGLTERTAAHESGVSHGWAGRCHRTAGKPEKEKR